MQSSLLLGALALLATLGLAGGLVFVFGTLLQRAENQRPCPECGAAELRWVEGVKATILVHGRRAPDSWSLHECGACGARLKDHRGKWVPPSDSDLRYFPPRDSVSG